MMRFAAITLLAGLNLISSAFAQNAADAYYGRAEMAAARAATRAEHGAQTHFFVLGERLEYHSNSGDPKLVWDGQGWFGGDVHRLWVKTEGEYAFEGDRLEEAEVQLLYSRAISPFWELQAGIRHDTDPDPSRSYAVIGMQGLAPQWFELDGALFLSDEGNVSARIEAEYEFRFTQRLMLQPRIELNAAFSDDRAIGVGSGLSTIESGLRLRYEVVREFAPYVGVSWSRSLGTTKDFQRIAGRDTTEISFVAGLRFWF